MSPRAYIEPAVSEVDVIIFGEKRCHTCTRKLPRNTEFFARDISEPSGLTKECKGCRNARERIIYQAARAAS